MTCLSSSTLKRATPPVPPSIKLGGNGFTTKSAVGGKWEVAPITHPMIMSFDGMTQFLHQHLMKCRRNLQLRGSSMIKRVLGQPNFSPQTNATQLFPKINTNFNNLSSVKVNTNI